MSDTHDHFSVFKIFIILLVMTALEVVYGIIGNMYFYENKLLLWGGLLLCAYVKGYYIFMYFMHVKYEGMIVKGNVLFTVPLVIYLMIMLTPDTATNDKFNYGIAQQYDSVTSRVESIGAGSRNIVKDAYKPEYEYWREKQEADEAAGIED